MAKRRKIPKTITASDFQKKYNKQSEASEQAHVLKYVQLKYPKLLYTVDLAGLNLTPAQRKIYDTRCKRGHPDLMFQEWWQDVFCGLAIEFKKTGELVTPYHIKHDTHLQEQLKYLNDLRDRGWLAVFVIGKENAKKVIDLYLKGTEESLLKINKYVVPTMNFKKYIDASRA